MKASAFFSTELKDNNYSGFKINVINTAWYSEQFNCSISRESSYSSETRQEAVANFVWKVHNLIAQKSLGEMGVSLVSFGEEFAHHTIAKRKPNE